MSDRRRRRTAISRLMDSGALEPGTRLSFRPPPRVSTQVDRWLGRNPSARYSTLLDDGKVCWQLDGRTYSMSNLTVVLLDKAGVPKDKFQGSACWANEDGLTVKELAALLPD
jgi:hypothetical protein